MSIIKFACHIGSICLLLSISGCGSLDRVRPQALQPSDRDLSSIEHNLVFFAVNIEQKQPTLKLRGIQARHNQTRKLYAFPFFDNLIMRSKELPHVIRNNSVEHLVFLDLPEGIYSILKLEFFNIERASKLSRLNQKITQPLLFEVRAGIPSYLGQLNVRIGMTSVVDSHKNVAAEISGLLAERERGFPRASEPTGNSNRPNYAVAIAGLEAQSRKIETLSGTMTISITNPQPNDIQRVKSTYPALAVREISSGRIWLGP